MISRSNKKELDIFDSFNTDQNLPKHVKRRESETNDVVSFEGSSVDGNWQIASPTTVESDMTYWVDYRKYMFGQNNTIINWVKLKIAQSMFKNKMVAKPVKTLNIREFFSDIKDSVETIAASNEIADHYEKVLLKAKDMNQRALITKLTDLLEVVRAETVLIGTDLNKFVTEKNVIDFYNKIGEDKHLKLSWMKNFVRVIPDDVYELKQHADTFMVFDNYVVLHYDPLNNGDELTTEEKEKAKDPILFGVIKNSHKLYYIADWVDEYCDLTLEEMFKELGSKVGEINNKSVHTFIDKIKA
jgi:hypothetical protein